MKTTLYWVLALIITLAAAYYQRQTGPSYPKKFDLQVNGTVYEVKLTRSIEISDRHYIKLAIQDTSMEAKLFYKRYKVDEPYQPVEFVYEEHPVNSFVMNKIFKMTEEKGFFAYIPAQPPAGKVEYYFEIRDKQGRSTYFKNEPIVIRFKGAVPSKILTPHILLMFIAMLLSTLAGLMALGKHKSYRKWGIWSFIILFAGGMILGPMVQYHAFGEAWTGIPLGWDLTDNKTLIAVIFWGIAFFGNLKRKRPALTVLASAMLLLVYSIPHSMFGSELDYESGTVIQGIILSLMP
ncbi:MAG TPA: hypothetical protein ENN86_03145 [Desulfobacteraceae bacterium]|nr:hypothetical protein [Desulfobacteraceae bacterium]